MLMKPEKKYKFKIVDDFSLGAHRTISWNGNVVTHEKNI